MLKPLIAALMLAAPLPALAGAAAAPADKAIVGPRELIWAASSEDDATTPEQKAAAADDDYFSKSRLKRIYTKSFARLYRSATKNYAARDYAEPMFDWDVVLGGQDGCSPKDISFTTKKTDASHVRVDVSYRMAWCFDGSDEATKAQVSSVRFLTTLEDGAYKIDDIQHLAGDKIETSVREALEYWETQK
ncbi:hypothetical protein [Rhizobium sp. FKL33]|uniref:hypothetical protein n=1 Tax=Rhizobium sp. FKL33 TaxID=2562307 RepID=UPI0010C08263|nr:hypothetical protein [Rhizobium sp. FKL33]